MVLESTMLCLDNSDWMRNGDYAPSRLESQHDAAGLICNDRLNSNPENTVGILSMAGTGVNLLVSPTEESGKVLSCFGDISIGGKSDLSTAVQIAQLALKHRKNKNGGQRIIVFVGGPVFETKEKLLKIGKQLKKNNVAINVVSMGEIEENSEKLLEFVNATNSNDNSHLITVPAGVSPANAILGSALMHMGGGMGNDGVGGGGGGGGGGGEGDNFDMYGGIDPSMDPELAMAIRASTEEARAQEEARQRAAQEAGGGGSSAAAGGEAPSSSSASAGEFGGAAAADEEDEDALMQRALEMSMREMLSVNESSGGNGGAGATAGTESKVEEEEEDEDDELARALQLSVGADATSTSAFSDPSFASSLLSAADPSDPLVQAALAQLQQQQAQSGTGSAVDEEESNNTDATGKKRKGDDK